VKAGRNIDWIAVGIDDAGVERVEGKDIRMKEKVPVGVGHPALERERVGR